MKRFIILLFTAVIATLGVNGQVFSPKNSNSPDIQKYITQKPLKNDSKGIQNYSFSYTIGTFEPINTTGTRLTPNNWDDGQVTLDLTGTFAFNYNDSVYTVFSIGTNGVMKFGTGDISSGFNDLGSSSRYPVLAPLWDELTFNSPSSSDGLFYQIDSLPSDTILTIEWHHVTLDYASGSDIYVNFQVKLHTTGLIEFVYDDMSNALNWSSVSTSASIGINDRKNGTTHFISITPGNPPTASYTVENKYLNKYTIANIPAGRIYQFKQYNHDIDAFNILYSSIVHGNINLSGIIVNRGLSDESNIPVYIKIIKTDSTEVYSYNTSTSIESGETDTIDLGVWTAQAGKYNIKLYTALPTDENSINDTLVKPITIVDTIINMNNGTDTTCYALFYDSGGPDNNYQDNEDYTYTFYSADSTKFLQVNFLNYHIENYWDKLYVYKGDEVNPDKLLATITGNGSNLNIQGSSALTFRFKSDGSVNYAGWKAIISCYRPPQHELAIVNISPTAGRANYPFVPTITIRNNAVNSENNYSVEYTNIDGSYSGTQTYTTPINYEETITLNLPEWIHAEGDDSLTVILHLPNDENPENDTMKVAMHFMEGDALGIKSGSTSTYDLFNTATGNTLPLTTINTLQIISGEDYDGNFIYRVYKFGQIEKINLQNLQTTLLGNIQNVNGFVSGIAWNWTQHKFYIMILEGDNHDIAHLYTLNLKDLTLTSFDTIGTNTEIFGIDFGPQDTALYFVNVNTDTLYRMNINTKNITAIGPTNINVQGFYQDISYHYDKDSLYTVAYPPGIFGAYDMQTGEFREIQNKNTLYTTFVTLTTPYPLYTVTFNITNGTEPVANAEIEIAGRYLTTDTNGQATIKLGNGDYNAYVSAGCYQIDTTQFNVNGNDTEVNITLNYSPHSAYFTVLDAETLYPIADATIQIDTNTAITDVNGHATLPIHCGDFTAIITKLGYNPDTVNFSIADTNISLNVFLTSAMHTVNFTVVDQDNNPLENAVITVNDNSVITDANGQASMSLIDGNYTAYTNKEGYKIDTTEFSVEGADVNVDISLTPLPAIVDKMNNIYIMPNPANDHIVISTDKNYKVELIDITGKILQTLQMKNNRTQIDLSGYKAGIYILKLTGESVYTYRIIKQ